MTRNPASLMLLFALTSFPVAAATLPASYVELIRHDKFAEAEAAATAQTAAIEADPKHKPEALCAALNFQQRVDGYDLYQPRGERQAAIERALQCYETLHDSPDAAAHIVQLKGALSAVILVADRKRAAELAAEAAPALRRFRQQLDPFDYGVSANGIASTVSIVNNDYEGSMRLTREAVEAESGDDLVTQLGRARFLPMLCYRYGRLGRFDDAEATGRSGVELAARAYGAPSVNHAYALRQLGQVQYFAHHTADAAVTMEQAVEDGRTLGGDRRDDLAASLMIWANVLNDLGNYDRGRGAYTEAIAIMRASKTLQGANDLPAALSNLGMLEAASGHCEAALEPEREALQIYRARFGDDNDSVVSPLTVLGNCELETGQIEKARADYTLALSISQKSLGEDNPQIAEQYQQLALVDLAAHDFAAAQTRLTKALSRLPADPETLGSQRIVIERNLARALHAQHDDKAAFEHAAAGEATRQRLLQHFAAALDESEALGANETEHDNLDEIMALAAAGHDPAWIERAWQLQIGARSQVTHLVAARLKAARASSDSALRILWEKWKNANATYTTALGDAESGKPETSLAGAREALERAEQALATQTHALGHATTASLAELRASLPKDAALIAFVRERADAWDNDFASVQHPRHYYAFRLDASAAPIALVDLGDAHAIDAAIRDWTAALRDPTRSVAQVDAFGADVTRRVWQPLDIGDDVRRVYIVPEGELHRMAWLALPLREGPLAEKGPVPHLLDSERDLLVSAPSSSSASHALLIGAVTPDPALATTPCGKQVLELPGAKRELETLRDLWRQTSSSDANFLLGNDASKSAVRAALAQMRFVHFATHAFSDDNDCIHTLLAARDVHLSKTRKPKTATGLSGLLLATDAHAAPGDRDGLLTPQEIVAFDLDGVDTVTLAACDTGSGVVHADEGVFGLARAFRLAGARNVVMSLWSIDDDATADFMQRMYRARWLEHASSADSLASAARAVLAARRAEGKSIHPYYWAAFVAAGN